MTSGRKYRGRPSTDGTRLGADIAETMGSDDEKEIIRKGIRSHSAHVKSRLTGMSEEQADWESDLGD